MTSFQYLRYGNRHLRPLGPIAVISHQVDSALSDAINFHLRNRRSLYLEENPELDEWVGYYRSDYRVPVDLTRFNSGEGRAQILETVRGHDLFIITDVLNYGQYTTRFNRTVSISPDEHYQDLVRLIAATHGVTRRINVMMPYLYEGRRYRRHNRGSLDGALILKQLFEMGVTNVFTFDAHDGRIANAVPRNNFETLPTSLQIIEALVDSFDDLQIDRDHFMIVAPDEMAISRCIYYASLMHVPLGICYRQYDQVNSLQFGNEIIEKRFLGDDVEGKDVLIVDDMIDTGKTILDVAKILKEKGARRIFAAVTFALFTKGFEKINQAYESGHITKIFATNAAYRPPVLLDSEWYCDVNLSKYAALMIDAVNHDASLSSLLDPTERIDELLKEHRERGND